MIDIHTVIRGLDDLFARGKTAEAGDYLRQWRENAIRERDQNAELSILSEMMGYYRRTGQEREGLEAVERGLALLDELRLEDTVDGGTILLNAATCLRSFGQTDRGLALYAKSLFAFRNLPSDSLLLAGLYNNMASAYGEKQDFDTASGYLTKSLDILVRNGGSVDEAVVWVNLAQTLYAKDPLDEKIYTYMDNALRVFDRPQEKTSYYAETCRKCASAFGFFGYFDAEKDLNERADRIYAGASTFPTFF